MIQTDTKPEVIIPEGAELIDECFYVWKTRYGLFSSMTKQGRQMLTGAVRDNVIIMTRFHLQCEKALQHFGTRVEIITAMEMANKLSSEDAYQMIKSEMKEMKKVRRKQKDD